MKISTTASQQILQLLTQYHGEITEGDRLTGRILSIQNGLLQLQLFDGSNLSARVESGTQYHAGDVLQLEVMGEKQGQFFVRELEHTPMQFAKGTENPAAILQSLNLPADPSRLEVVKALLNMGIKPGAELVEKSIRLLGDPQVSDAGQAVFLILNGMENNASYFPLLQQMLGKTFHFTEKWQHFAEQIRNLDDTVLVRIAEELTGYERIQEMDFSLPAKEITAIIQSGNPPGFTERENITEGLLKAFIFEYADRFGASSRFDAALPEPIERLLPGFTQLTRLQQMGIRKVFANFLKDLPGEDVKSTVTIAEAKKVIARCMTMLPHGKRVQSEAASFPKVNQWLKDAERKLTIIEKAVTESETAGSEKVIPLLREMNTAIRFFQDIQSYEAFVQIPLVLKERATQGELYVMKRKGKRGKMDADDFSLLLSLVTQNLGVMDTFIHVRNKNVMLRVMVEQEKFFGLIEEEYKPLYEALKQKGYRLFELKFALKDEEITLLNADTKASEFIRRKQKIDYRV